jgi:uncharacterized membrane protein
MTSSDSLEQASSNRPLRPGMRRWLPGLIVVGALLLLAFYTVVDSYRVADSHLLNGADWVAYAICHRISERSFSIAGRQLPLCARCTGMYLGVILIFLVLALSGRLAYSELPPWPVLLLLVSFIGLMGIDGVNSYLHFFPNAPHLYEPRNWLRLVSGMGTGLAMGLFVFPALAQTLWRHPDGRRVVDGFREMFGLLLLAALLILLVLSNQPAILYVLALASATGVLMIVTVLQTTLFLILSRRDGRAARWYHSAVPLFLGLLLTIAEIAAVGWLRFNLTGTMTGFPGL